MSKTKSLALQIEEIETSTKKLSYYEKLFDKACKINFGCNSNSIHKMLANNTQSQSYFETKICQYFCLKSNDDLDDFLEIICTETCSNYYKKMLAERAE